MAPTENETGNNTDNENSRYDHQNLSSSDSNDDSEAENHMNGYELLPQAADAEADTNAENVVNDHTERHQAETDHNAEENNCQFSFPYLELESSHQTQSTDFPSIRPISSQLSTEIWNKPRNNNGNSNTNALTDDKINLVRNIMSSISLPPENIPEWAKQIPEEEWKTTLLKKLPGHAKDENPSE